jgi:hypothetical protein
MNESEANLITIEYFKKKYGITFNPITISEKEGVKTPDLYCEECNIYAEVKTLEYVIPSPETGFTRETEHDWWQKKDNSPSRVSSIIKNAFSQLSGYDGFKIIVFINNESEMDAGDLIAALQGWLPFRSEQTGQVSRMNLAIGISFERIKEIKTKVDLYVWIDLNKNEDFSRFSKTKQGYELKKKLTANI